MAVKTFAEIAKFNPYHDNQGRFASANGATSFTYAPGKSTAHDKAIQRGKEAAQAEKGFKGTLYHGSPATDIEEFDMSRAGENTSSGEKLIFFTDSKQMAEDFSYERLEGSSKFFQRRGKKGRVYEVDVEMKNPLDFRNLSDKDIDNLIKLDPDGLLTKEVVQRLSGNHQLLKTSLDLSAENLKKLGYDGLIANTGKAGHNSLEYAVVDSSQAKILKAAPSAMTFDEILKFNPYHDNRGRFASANSATSFTHRTRDPAKQGLADAAIAREKERQAGGAKPDAEEETPRMKAIHSIEDKIRNQNYETAAIIDKDGNVLLNKDGAQSAVGFTPLECKMMKDATLTHNHPRSSMFSDEDIQCFVRNEMEEIRATTREGVTFSVKRGEGYSRADGTVFLLEYQINAGLARNTAQTELDARGFADKIMRGEMSHAEANKEFGKVVTRELKAFCEKKAPEYNLEFTVETRNVGKSADTDDYILLDHTYTAKADDTGESIILDKETEEKNDAAFQEWLGRTVKKFNPNHDHLGRFASAPGSGVALSGETEEYLRAYTAGKYKAACAISQEIAETGGCSTYAERAKTGQIGPSEVETWEKDVTQTKAIMQAINSQPTTSDELVRIEIRRGEFSTGDEFVWGIRSTSADTSFGEKVYSDNDEGLRHKHEAGTKLGLVEYRIVGEKKALNIEEYSEFDQQERLVQGKFRVKSVQEVKFTPDNGVTIAEAVKQDPAVAERFVSFTSKKGKPMVRDTKTGNTYTEAQTRQKVLFEDKVEDRDFVTWANEMRAKNFVDRTVVVVEQVFD